MRKLLDMDQMEAYCQWLYENEKSNTTIQKYRHHLLMFFAYLENRKLEKKIRKSVVLEWKEWLKGRMAPTSINNALAALNSFFRFCGRKDLAVRYLRVRKQVFCPEERELDRSEYERLVKTAVHLKKERLSLLLQTICATGIRISELKFITVESLEQKCAEVECKGRIRTVWFPRELCRMLKDYVRRKRIVSGMVFVTRTGKALDRSNVWREMKQLGQLAGVQEQKIFPHNLRHLFARVYYNQEKDLSRLADILGHCNVNTTKIYTRESGKTHVRQIEQMNLVMSEYNGIYLML